VNLTIPAVTLLAAIFFIGSIYSADAAVDMFLKIDDVKGESKDVEHLDEIEVLAWSWGLTQSGTTHTGAGGGAGKVSVQDISVTKYTDKSTPKLLENIATGKFFQVADLTVRKAGEKPITFVHITMDNALVTSISMGGSGGEDRLTENITLNFAKFKFEYTPQDDKGAGAPQEFSWDIAANKAG